MVVDRLIAFVLGVSEFDSIVLVEVCRIDDHRANRHVVDGAVDGSESIVVDGCGGHRVDFGYGLGGYDGFFFSRILGA